jgi:hypothetical protein
MERRPSGVERLELPYFGLSSPEEERREGGREGVMGPEEAKARAEAAMAEKAGV